MAPTDVRTIHVPYPEATDRELRITADACHIHLQPGAGEEWVSGTYQDPSGQRSPTLTMDGGTLTIDHHRTTRDLTGELVAGDPVFDLLLGTRQPYALTIQAAAIQSDAELGGLPITRLVITRRRAEAVSTSAKPTHSPPIRCRSAPKGLPSRPGTWPMPTPPPSH